MNWLVIVVLLVIAFGILHGYHRGLLRMVYSAISWIIALVFVAWTTPYINSYLLGRTGIYERVAQHCEEAIQRSAEEKLLMQPEGVPGVQQGIQIDEEPGLPGISAETQVELAKLGIKLPENVLESIASQSAAAAGEFLEASGIYSEMAAGMARFIVQGISFLIALMIAGIAVHVISRLLGIVSHIPVINGANRIAGLFVGGLYGIVAVWIAFYIIALCSASETGSMLVSYIYENPFLKILYENNLIVSIMLRYL